MVLLFTLWQVGELGFLYLIPSELAVRRIYFRLEKASAGLLPDLPDGHTPHQLGAALAHKFRGIINRILKSLFLGGNNEIEQIVSLYVTQVFSGHPPTKSQVRNGIRAWARLRWRLWIANRWAHQLIGRSLDP